MTLAKTPKPKASKPKSGKKSSVDRIVYQIEESRAGTGYQAECPELVITGFGDTAEEAKDSLRRQLAEYLEDCEELQVLDETLIEAGFYFNGDVWMSNEVEPAPDPKIRFIGRLTNESSGEPAQ